MNAARASGEKTVKHNEDKSYLKEALWLARKDVRRAWLSYPVTALFVLALAIFIVPGIDDVVLDVEGFRGFESSFEAVFNAIFADYMFLILGCVLAINSLSADYLRIYSTDVFSQRLIFLRSLPFSVRSLVASRVFSMLAALPLTAPAFFVPAYLLSNLRELGASYVWFIGIWLGWSLLYAGLTLFCEFTTTGRFYVWFSLLFVAGVLVGVVLLEVFVNMQLVARTASLALNYGPVAAPISLFIGVAGFALFARATANKLERRDFSA